MQTIACLAFFMPLLYFKHLALLALTVKFPYLADYLDLECQELMPVFLSNPKDPLSSTSYSSIGSF